MLELQGRNILITGGAGFIGSHLSRRLLEDGCNVTVLDNFSPQIHGVPGDHQATETLERITGRRQELAQRFRLIVGDVRDKAVFTEALQGQDSVVHLAAETGTGQSMYEVEKYEDVNLKGTSVLMDYLVNSKSSRVKKIVVASSRAVYGEGKYACANCGVVYPLGRRTADMKAGRFDPVCPRCDATCRPLPTDEASDIHPTSFYGLTKHVQERMTLLFAGTLGLSGFGLRYQNVYGPGQSLKNPYTGILAIFSNRARANQPIEIFEDGEESRDFVYIADVVEATCRCLHPEIKGVEAINVGSEKATTVREVATEIVNFFGSSSTITTGGAFREGDIRHNLADLTKARRLLGYEPRWGFREGIAAFLQWASEQEASQDKYEQSLAELKTRGLIHGLREPRA